MKTGTQYFSGNSHAWGNCAKTIGSFAMKAVNVRFVVSAAIATLFLFPLFLQAQVPPQMNFQAKLLDKSNNPINATVSIVFSIYNVPTGGTALWTETQPSVTVSNGVYDVEIGSVVPLSTAAFSGGTAYLGIKISPDTSEMTPREKLVSSPYSLVSSELTSNGEIQIQAGGGGVNVSTFSTDGNLIMAYGITATTGTFTGTLTMSGANADIVSASSITAGEFFGNGAGLTNLPAVTITTNTSLTGAGTGASPLGINLGNANTWTAAQTLSGGANFPGSGIWNTSGNVGIGTASPGYPLQISNSATGCGNELGVFNGADYTVLTIQGSSPCVGTWPATSAVLESNQGGLVLDAYGSNQPILFQSNRVTAMTVQGSNVGIGTTGPSTLLNISGATGAGANLFMMNDTTNGNALGLGAGPGEASIYNTSNNALYLGTNNTTRMAITAAGNVGVGTTSPGANLDVFASGTQNNLGFRVSNATGTIQFINYFGGGGYNSITQTGDQGLIFYGGSGSGSGNFVIAPWSAAVSGIRMTSAGNVGIGIASPGYTLDVSGNVHASGEFYGNGAGLTSVTSVITVTSFYEAPVSLADVQPAYIMPRNGTIAQIYLVHQIVGSSGSTTIQYYVNGTAAFSCSIAYNATVGTASSCTESYGVSAGNAITAAVTATSSDAQLTAELIIN